MSIPAELPNHRHTEEGNGGEFAIEYAHETDNDVNEQRQARNCILCAFYVALAISAIILLVCLLVEDSTT